MIVTPNGTTTSFSSADIAHVSSVSASLNGVVIGSITFTVIKPTGSIFTNVKPKTYTAGLSGSGFNADDILQPLSVCFSGIEVQEQEAIGVATGYYDIVLKWDKSIHDQGTWCPVDSKNYSGYDTVGTKTPGGAVPFSAGTFLWAIPCRYQRAGGGASYYYATSIQTQKMSGSSGYETTKKNGAQNSR